MRDKDLRLGRVIWLFLIVGSLFSLLTAAIGAVAGAIALSRLLLETASTQHAMLFSLGCTLALILDQLFARRK